MSLARPVLAVSLVPLVLGVALFAQKADPAKDIRAAIQLVDDISAGQAAPNELSLSWEHEDYLKAQDRKQYVPFTLSIDPSKVTSGSVALYWRVVARTAGESKKRGKTVFEDNSSAPVTGSGPVRISRSFTVPSGAYDVYVVAKEPEPTQGSAPPPKVSVLKHEITVPDFWNGDLATSTVIIAERINQLSAPLGKKEQAERPYALGTVEITPSSRTVFPRSSSLSTYMHIYNPKTDSANKPDVVVECSFYSKAPDGQEKFFNKTEPENLNAKTLPPQFDLAAGHVLQTGPDIRLSGFPEGDYRLEIKVTDNIAKKSVTREIPFRVGQP